ncbi:MAG TPA: PadR family transcriptional regulator [Acidimicrobiales bacterium]|jgi:DNA-binding PadR family transcriptional regulator
MPRQARSNPLALAVLVTLYEKPAHPYQVAQTLRERAKQESVRLNYGSLYAVVESLEKRGLIRAIESVREGKRPERTVYEITNEGSTEMIDWLTELLAVPAKEYPAFMAGLSFIGALTPEDAIGALRLRAEAISYKLAQLRGGIKTAQQVGLPRLFALESEFEENQMANELHFVNALVKELDAGDFDGMDMWRAFHSDGPNPFEGVTFTQLPDPT